MVVVLATKLKETTFCQQKYSVEWKQTEYEIDLILPSKQQFEQHISNWTNLFA